MLKILPCFLVVLGACRTNCASLVRSVNEGCPDGSSAQVLSESGGGGGGSGEYGGKFVVKGTGETQGTCEVACVLPYTDTGYYYDTGYYTVQSVTP